jgi:hypothetical protein
METIMRTFIAYTWWIVATLGILPVWAETDKTYSLPYGNPRYTVPEDMRIMYSATWNFTAQCDNKDQVLNVKWVGTSTPPSWKIPPWEKEAIMIIGVEFLKIKGGPTNFFMIGNNYVSDAMIWIPKNTDHGRSFFPSGYGMPLPAMADAQDGTYLDLHGSCNDDDKQENRPLEGFVTIYYTPQ